jgi:hypothetical protein
MIPLMAQVLISPMICEIIPHDSAESASLLRGGRNDLFQRGQPLFRFQQAVLP